MIPDTRGIMRRPIFLVEHGRNFKRSGWRLVVFASVLLAQVSCDRKDEGKKAPVDEVELPLLEPEAARKNLPSRCSPVSESRPFVLRADSGDSKRSASAVEVGDVIALGDAFAVAGLRSGAATSVFVTWVDGYGKQKTIDLGKVHGAVEPPLLAATGSNLIVAVTDNDAMSTRIRLARIADPQGEGQVTWGPEVQARRDESAGVSLAVLRGKPGSEPRALLAWDDFSKASSRSQVRGLWFSPRSMQATGGPVALTPAEQDSVEPKIAPRPGGGAWLTWISYAEMQSPSGPRELDSPLVEEPPRMLNVAVLGGGDSKFGASHVLSPLQARVLAFDAAPQGDELLVAYRAEDPQQTLDQSSIRLSRVTPGGAVTEGGLSAAQLGPGAPLILSSSSSGASWLVARGEEQQLLLGEIDKGLNVPDFGEEPSLEGQIPLLRRENRLLLMAPDGLDLRFSQSDCLAKPTSSGASKASPSP